MFNKYDIELKNFKTNGDLDLSECAENTHQALTSLQQAGLLTEANYSAVLSHEDPKLLGVALALLKQAD